MNRITCTPKSINLRYWVSTSVWKFMSPDSTSISYCSICEIDLKNVVDLFNTLDQFWPTVDFNSKLHQKARYYFYWSNNRFAFFSLPPRVAWIPFFKIPHLALFHLPGHSYFMTHPKITNSTFLSERIIEAAILEQIKL